MSQSQFDRRDFLKGAGVAGVASAVVPAEAQTIGQAPPAARATANSPSDPTATPTPSPRRVGTSPGYPGRRRPS